MKLQTKTLLAATVCAVAGQTASAAEFAFVPGNFFFEGRWGIVDYWSLVSGVDDGTPNIPDGLDTFTIDRTSNPVNSSKLVLDGGGTPNPLVVAGFTGTGAGPGTTGNGVDIQIKTFDLIVGDVEILASPSPFVVSNERDRDFVINGVLSGAGDLVLSRSGGFSSGGVTPDEVFLLTGSSPNTITGNITMRNTSNGAQPSFWVADKVGAFGEAASLLLEVNGTGGGTNVAQLVLTANTSGGEGAIDDDATTVTLGLNAEFNVAAGVDEFIGSGLLSVDGIGVVPDGIYDSSESWIVGDGTITVGVPEPSSLALLGLAGLMVARRRRG